LTRSSGVLVVERSGSSGKNAGKILVNINGEELFDCNNQFPLKNEFTNTSARQNMIGKNYLL
jgi:hypothetical protein